MLLQSCVQRGMGGFFKFLESPRCSQKVTTEGQYLLPFRSPSSVGEPTRYHSLECDYTGYGRKWNPVLLRVTLSTRPVSHPSLPRFFRTGERGTKQFNLKHLTLHSLVEPLRSPVRPFFSVSTSSFLLVDLSSSYVTPPLHLSLRPLSLICSVLLTPSPRFSPLYSTTAPWTPRWRILGECRGFWWKRVDTLSLVRLKPQDLYRTLVFVGESSTSVTRGSNPLSL